MKFNYKINKYATAFFMAGALTLSSCGEDDLQINPQQSLSTELAFADELTAQGSLMGVYSRAQDLEAFGAMLAVINEYMADNVNFIGSFITLQDINNYATLSNNTSLQSVWRDHFRVILAANAVIANVPNVDDAGFSAEEKAQFVAEAKFMRALTYFQLVNSFAHPYQVENGNRPGVPLVLEAYTGKVLLPARATVNEVHTQIQKDLTEAEAALSDGNNTRASKSAARALLSRLHLYRGEWQQAATFAQQTIDGGAFSLASDFSFYSKNTPEEIFSLQNSATDNGRTGSGGWASYYQPAELGGRGDALFSEYLLASFDENDKRFTDLHLIMNGNAYTTKFKDGINNTDNVPILRMTEMYLNRAEALAELNGVNAESISLINTLRTRAGVATFSTSDFASKDAFLEAIAEERRKELCFEGHRRMDLLRQGKALRPAGDPYFAESQLGATRTVMPIPQRELDLNTSLVQNAGY